jgi:FtsH-binding integral membrane protein
MLRMETSPVVVRGGPAPYLARVYGWMTLGLAVSAAAALVLTSARFTLSPGLFAALAIAEIGLVIVINFAMDRLSPRAATMLFLLYSALTGVTLSALLYLYDLGTVGMAFLVSAATFGVMAAVGYVTRRDLGMLGGILFMALVGVVIASVVGLVWNYPGRDLVVTYFGLLVFIGLTAYDSWRLRRLAAEAGWGTEAEEAKSAILGALTLYLDLINIFLRVLAILGGRRRRG